MSPLPYLTSHKKMNTAKLFLAVDFSAVEKQALHCVAYELHSQFRHGRINAEDMYHVTLHFFKEVPQDRIKDIQKAMKQAAAGQKPFSMVTGKPGIFGSPDSAVVWIGLSQGLEELNNLHDRLEKQLAKEGFLEDVRPFTPHLTLGREIDTTAFATPIGSIMLPSMNLTASALTLLESKIVDGKPVYSRVSAVRFTGV